MLGCWARVLRPGYWVLGTGYWGLGPGYWAWYWGLVLGAWVLGAWVLGPGYWVLGTVDLDMVDLGTVFNGFRLLPNTI